VLHNHTDNLCIVEWQHILWRKCANSGENWTPPEYFRWHLYRKSPQCNQNVDKLSTRGKVFTMPLERRQTRSPAVARIADHTAT